MNTLVFACSLPSKIRCVRECTLESLSEMVFVTVYFSIFLYFYVYCTFFIVLHLCVKLNKKYKQAVDCPGEYS